MTTKSSNSLLLYSYMLLLFTKLYESIRTRTTSEPVRMQHLERLLAELLTIAHIQRCFVIITDDWYDNLYGPAFFHYPRQPLPYMYIKIDTAEDLLAPNYQTVRLLKQIKALNCDLHIITILNGWQVKRLLIFIERYRILNMGRKFILLHDVRLIAADMVQVWNKILSTLFIKPIDANSYSITRINFPGILDNFVTTRELMKWSPGKRLNRAHLFSNNYSNLKGFNMPVAVLRHAPMVMYSINSANIFTGVEIEIVRALGLALNFKPNFYQSPDAELERWGKKLPNNSYTGLIGEVTNGHALIAIGDLHIFSSYRSILDFSTSHSYERLTFLTPESSEDASWQTFIQPFSTGMWIGVLLSLFVVGTLFYILSFLHVLLVRRKLQQTINPKDFFTLFRKRRANLKITVQQYRDANFRRQLNRLVILSKQYDLFDSFSNCILLTYSMMMYVPLPKTPQNWPLRVLTGWYWIYCILLTVAYRASFTAILANPAPRITIDTIDELKYSRLTLSVATNEHSYLFQNAFDEILNELATRTELLADIGAATELITKGTHAYYDNEYYLRHLRYNDTDKSQASSGSLHIMKDSIITLPAALALPRNSPFKTHIDHCIRHLLEFGLIAKWLHDSIKYLPMDEETPQEALINLEKFWSCFVPLFIGYSLALICILIEYWHFYQIINKHPLYNKYNPKLYYNFKRKYPDN